jgi:hypothetical protein
VQVISKAFAQLVMELGGNRQLLQNALQFERRVFDFRANEAVSTVIPVNFQQQVRGGVGWILILKWRQLFE